MIILFIVARGLERYFVKLIGALWILLAAVAQAFQSYFKEHLVYSVLFRPSHYVELSTYHTLKKAIFFKQLE